jgi:hypothetical protein
MSKPRRLKVSNIVEGEVILVDQSKLDEKGIVAEEKVIELSGSQAQTLKPKRPLTDKQKLNVLKLNEFNKSRKEARLQDETLEHSFEIPETIPEGKVAVKVKPIKEYTFTKKKMLEHMLLVNQKLIDLDKKLSSPAPVPVLIPAPVPQNEVVIPKKPKFKRQPRRVVSDSETTELDDTELDTDVEEVVHRKINKRLNSIKQIENQLQQTNKYVRNGLSVF